MQDQIIDTHVHVWNLNKVRYSWLDGDISILNRSYSLNELEPERQKAGVTGGILVQAANNLEDTDWMLEEAGRHPWIKGIVGWLPLEDPAQCANVLENKYLPEPRLCGVRHLIHNEPDHRWLLQENVVRSLSLLENHGYPYDLVGIKTDHIITALELAEKLPGLRMVFDHMNQPPILKKEKFGEWGVQMKKAAAHPNFYMKISGLGTASGNFEEWKPADLEPYISFALEYFGTSRCFCGGDWPVSLLAGNYSGTWMAYRHVLDTLLDRDERKKVYFENALRFYRLGQFFE
jgi:L-fuconolactonase